LLCFLIAIAAGTTDGGLGREIAERTIHSLKDAERSIPLILPIIRHEPVDLIGDLSPHALSPHESSYLDIVEAVEFLAPLLSPPSSPKPIDQDASRKRTFEAIVTAPHEEAATSFGAELVNPKIAKTNPVDQISPKSITGTVIS
jgi:hypothetical protein